MDLEVAVLRSVEQKSLGERRRTGAAMRPISGVPTDPLLSKKKGPVAHHTLDGLIVKITQYERSLWRNIQHAAHTE